METFIKVTLILMFTLALGFGGHHLYRVINYLEETSLGVEEPYEEEVCYDVGDYNEICDDVLRYPVVVAQYWSDTKLTNVTRKHYSKARWVIIRDNKGYY